MDVIRQLLHRLATVSPGVDLPPVLHIVGTLLKWFAATFAAPAVVALGAGETPLPFLLAGLAAAVAGVGLDRLVPGADREPLGPREGFLVVALVWLLIPAFGALPFLLSGRSSSRGRSTPTSRPCRGSRRPARAC